MADESLLGRSQLRAQLPAVLRIGIAGLLLGPGVSKFLTYERSVRFFAALGLPAPELLVPIVGVVELAAAALLFLDRSPRAAALLVVPVMAVAVVTAGPAWQNVGIIGAALLLVALETTADTDPVTEPTT